MKLFAKFIPVKGEPKEGDIVMGTNGVCVVWGNIGRHGLQSYTWEEGIQHMRSPRKADLFLCSRNVVVGDNVYQIINDKLTDEFEWIYEMKEQAELSGKPNIFKVIGKLSPAAKFVREGDEFDSNNVLYAYGVPVRKTYRNGEVNHTLLCVGKNEPEEWEIEDAAKMWAEDESSGQVYGYKIFWNEKPPFVDHIRVLGPCGYHH